jgi:tetratricopeptide (TPR) repeat protein
MRTFARFMLILGLIASFLFTRPAAAQSNYTLGRAQAFAQANDWEGLLAYGQGWSRAEPNNPDAWYSMARAYGSKLYNFGLKRPNDAAPCYQHAVALRPQWPEAWYALGMTQQETGDFNGSIVALNHAVEQAPARTNYWYSLFSSYSHIRKFELAIQALGNLEKNSRTPRDWFLVGSGYSGLAVYYGGTPVYQKARAAYLRSLKMDERQGGTWTNLGTVEQVLGNLGAALDDYQKGARLWGKVGANDYTSLTQDIQACKGWRQRIASNAHPMGLDVVNYNQHCTNITGKIPIVFVPR